MMMIVMGLNKRRIHAYIDNIIYIVTKKKFMTLLVISFASYMTTWMSCVFI